jgi:hypothetical protein
MRYYAIVISGAPASFPARYDGGAQWGTEFNGQYDPGAQQVEFQIEEWRPNIPTLCFPAAVDSSGLCA